MMSAFVFAYGTLLDKKMQQEILGRNPKTYPAFLSKFRLESITIDGQKYPIIIEDFSANELIKGEYFKVDEDDLKKLDAYETDAYRRVQVLLENGLLVWVYCL
jgi:gamma-glutamylcyclotransferase (GGCT)/AIG2-like uncharacterized protein YtfP